tara:strand:- start:9 stop:782 length:774 start_codon:yes stop_codon:yes gene_type:complete
MISLLELAKSITEIDDDKMIKYRDKEGDSQEMPAGSAKKLPKDHPAKIAYDTMTKYDDYQDKKDGGEEKPKGSSLSGSDFDRDGSEDDNDKSDDVEISDANSGPIDREDIIDMLKNDSEIMDKIGGDDIYWDGMDLVSSKFDDATVASIPDDSNMTLGDLKQQILDYEPEDDRDDEPTHAEIMQYIEDEGYGGDAIGPDGNPTPEAYEDAKQELMYQKQNETITINGQKYKPIKEEKKKSNPHILKEIYDRTFRSLK